MSEVEVLTLHEEYNNILSLLDGTPYELNETESIIDITLAQDLSLELICNLGKSIEHFNFSCNPFSESFEDVIEDIKRNITDIKEIHSLSINLEKQFFMEKIENIDYVFFNKQSAINSIKNLSLHENNQKINLGIVNNEDVETELINFINLSQQTYDQKVDVKEINKDTLEHLEFYLSNNRKNEQTIYYNPYSFILKKNSNNNSHFHDLLKAEFYNTILQCLSDKDDNNYYVIRGEKNISILQEKNFSTENYLTLVDLFLFLISQKKYTEKFIIIKKVITLYIDDKETISDLDKKVPNIWKTINHYYNHYIEDNIKEFFKTKDQLLKEAMNASKVIYEQTDKISTSIIASIISVLVLLVTTLYRSLENLSAIYALLFIVIFFTFSLIYYKLMKDSSEKRFVLTETQFNHFINEISLIPTAEVQEIKKVYLLNPYAELENSLKRLRNFLLTFNIIFGVLFIIFYVNF